MKHQKLDTTPEISKRMSHVHLKKGLSETVLAKALWHQGLRYRTNYKKIPGSPDIAVTKYKIAIFVDGEFWHGYDWKNKKTKLKTHREYWVEKIEENMRRDYRNDALLEDQGWIVLHFWEKDVQSDLDGCVQNVLNAVIQSKVQKSVNENVIDKP